MIICSSGHSIRFDPGSLLNQILIVLLIDYAVIWSLVVLIVEELSVGIKL